MEITIRMNADEMLDAAARGLLEGLARCGKKEQTEPVAEQVQPDIAPAQMPQPIPTQAPQPVQMQEPVTQPVPTQPAQSQCAPQTAAPVEAPAAPVQDIPAAVPTQQVTYTMEDLALAATQLVDEGRLEQIQELLAKFGVQALTQLPKEQYGAFAAELRNMGAKI